jgi:hypothetical protein
MGFFKEADYRACKPCHSSCTKYCRGYRTNCNNCAPELKEVPGGCMCHDRFYLNKKSKICEKCLDPNCINCDDKDGK